MSLPFANATLTGLASPAGATTAGDVVTGGLVALSAPVVLDEPTTAQRYALGQVIAEATAVMYVEKVDLPAGVQPAIGGRAVVAVDGSAAVNYRVVHKRDREKPGGLSHWEVYLAV